MQRAPRHRVPHPSLLRVRGLCYHTELYSHEYTVRYLRFSPPECSEPTTRCTFASEAALARPCSKRVFPAGHLGHGKKRSVGRRGTRREKHRGDRVLCGRPSYDPTEHHPRYLIRREVTGNLAVERVGSTAYPRFRMKQRVSNYLTYLGLAVLAAR